MNVQRSNWRADILAGATVALVGVPQCLAYATMSGLPPAYGLATAVVPGFVAALAGRSRYVITGPTNTTGLLVLGALVPVLGSNGLLLPEGLGWLATLTLLCGLVRIAFAASGGAVVVRFIPESVLAGFTVGAGVLIGVMQLDEALGLPPVAGAGTFAEYGGIARHFAAGLRPSPAAVLVTAVSIGVIASGRYFRRRPPLALLVVLASAVIARVLGLSAEDGLPIVGDRAAMPAGWPAGAWPDLTPSVVTSLLLPAGAIVLLGTLELLVVTKADPSRPDLKREIVAQGAANAVGAFASAFPASASLTRSALLRYGSPSSRRAAAAAALFTLPLLPFGSALINNIPQSALAAVLLVTAFSMVAQPSLKRLWRASGVSRMLLAVTAVSTLVLPLEWAVFVGAGLGLVIHLARTSRPRVRALTFRGDRLVPIAEDEAPRDVVLEISGTVHYAAAESLLEQLEELLPMSARRVIVDLSHAHELRFTGLRALEWWADDLERRGVKLRLAGVTDEVRELIDSTHSRLPYTMWDAEPGRSVWTSYSDMQAG